MESKYFKSGSSVVMLGIKIEIVGKCPRRLIPLLVVFHQNIQRMFNCTHVDFHMNQDPDGTCYFTIHTLASTS